MAPRHYTSRYEITSVPSVGKFRCWDVILRVRSGKDELSKEASRIVKAWRGLRDGEPRQAALAEAHRLRDELDLSLDDIRR